MYALGRFSIIIVFKLDALTVLSVTSYVCISDLGDY